MASLADLAGGVAVGVASVADAGAASLADTRVASLADLAGSVAGGVMCLAEPVGVASDGMMFPKECDVGSRSVFGDSVSCDSEADYFGCEAPNAWCHDIPEIRGDSVCEYLAMWAMAQTVLTVPYWMMLTVIQTLSSSLCYH